MIDYRHLANRGLLAARRLFGMVGAIENRRLRRMRLRHVVPIQQPMVLISQVQRSGGTMLSQLFDGHPQCHVHPHELYIGYPDKYHWPELDLHASSDEWFRLLMEAPTYGFSVDGYSKMPDVNRPEDFDDFPFCFLPELQRQIFLQRTMATEVNSQRDVLNCYMTAYFNAWLDYQELYRPTKRWIVAFGPRISMFEDGVERYFEDYPDGRLLSTVRNPISWYVSSHRRSPRVHPDPATSVPIWLDSAKAMLANKRKYGDKVYLMSFESLVAETEGQMRSLAGYLGIDFNEILLRPTFQGMDIRANSAFPVKTRGVISQPLDRSDQLDAKAREFISDQTRECYNDVLETLDSPTP